MPLTEISVGCLENTADTVNLLVGLRACRSRGLRDAMNIRSHNLS